MGFLLNSNLIDKMQYKMRVNLNKKKIAEKTKGKIRAIKIIIDAHHRAKIIIEI